MEYHYLHHLKSYFFSGGGIWVFWGLQRRGNYDAHFGEEVVSEIITILQQHKTNTLCDKSPGFFGPKHLEWLDHVATPSFSPY